MTEHLHKKYTWLSVAIALVGTVFGAASATATWAFYAGQQVATMSKDIESGANHDIYQDNCLEKLEQCVNLLREQNARVDERLKNIDTRQVQMDGKLDRALDHP